MHFIDLHNWRSQRIDFVTKGVRITKGLLYTLSRLYLCLQVRLSALKVLNTVYNRLGEEMVVLLPKTIPFLSELMEGQC